MSKTKYMFIALFFSACAQASSPAPTLSITPQLSYIPDIAIAGQLTYGEPAPLDDPYFNGIWNVYINGVVGEFKLEIANNSNDDLINVSLIIIANDASKIDNTFFSRIYRQFFWGGDYFQGSTPIILPDNTPYPSNNVNGKYIVIDADDLPAHSKIAFSSLVLGDPDLKLHFKGFATTTNGQYAISMEQNELTVAFEY
jgi:hypothetical protein